MKLIYYELQKVLRKKIFYLIVILCLFVNISVFCFMQQNGSNRAFVFFDYPDVVNEYSDLPIDKAEENLKTEMMSYEILEQMNAVGDVEDTEEMDTLLSELSEMRAKFPNAYALAEEMQTADCLNRKVWI